MRKTWSPCFFSVGGSKRTEREVLKATTSNSLDVGSEASFAV